MTSRERLGALWLLAGRLRPRFASRPSPKLVALPTPIGSPSDPLRQAARDLVQAFDDYAANVDRRFDRAFRHGLGRTSFTERFGLPLASARKAYRKAAVASADPFHEHLATLVESNLSPYWIWTKTDGPVRAILGNWLREEPNIETQPAEDWVAQTSAVVKFASARSDTGYTSTLALEARQRLPAAAMLCIDVGTEVSIASAVLVLKREASARKADLIWKRSRIWVILEAPLEEGDQLSITLTTAKPIAQSLGVRLGSGAETRL